VVSGVVVAACCAGCAARELPAAEEFDPGVFWGLVDVGHAAELAAAGWTLTMYPDEAGDIWCQHYDPHRRELHDCRSPGA
jgi:hypothetical protein